MTQQNKDLLTAAVERYSKALTRRMTAKEKLISAQKEDTASAAELGSAKDNMNTLEHEMSECIETPNLRFSHDLHKGPQREVSNVG